MLKNPIKIFLKNSDLILVLVLGFVIRIIQIVKYELWFDEAFTGVLMRLPRDEFIKILTQDAHPPLYSLVLKVWTLIFGVNDYTLRAFSVFLGTGLIFLTYVFVKDFFNKNVAIISAVFVAINPFLIGYSLEARSYSLYAFLTLFSTYFLAKNKIWLFSLGIMLMIFTHYISVFYILVLIGYYLYLKYQKHIIFEKKELYTIIPSLIIVVAVSIYAKMISSVALNNNWVAKANFANIPKSFIAYIFGVKVKATGLDEINNINYLGLNQNILGIFLFGVFILGILICFKKLVKKNRNDLKKFMFILGMILIPQFLLVISGFVLGDFSIYVERYLIPSSVFLSISLAYILYELVSFEAIGIILILYVLLLLNITSPYYFAGIKSLAQVYAGKNIQFVFTSPVDYLVARYYFGEKENNHKVYNPLNPSEKFDHWPLLKQNYNEIDFSNMLLVTPDESRITQGFRYFNEFGNYKLYRKIY